MEKGSLLRELAGILRDYQHRIDTVGAEAFRLRGEPFVQWDRKQHRIRLCLELLEKAVRASDAGRLDELLREVAATPDVAVPAALARLPEPICSRCLRREGHHAGPGTIDHDCPDGFVPQAAP